MGTLFYGAQEFPIPVDDRALAHMKTVIIAKLRRNEAFMFSWQVAAEDGHGRQSVWIHPTIPVRFRFDGGRPPVLNREWIDMLMDTANSPGGLRAVSEPSGASASTGTGVRTSQRQAAGAY